MKNYYTPAYGAGLFMLLLYLYSGQAYGQNTYPLSGTVTDTTGQAIPGVHVQRIGTPQGTTTNFEGQYTLAVQASDSLAFTYLGLAPQRVAVNGKQELDIQLKPDQEALETVVINAGYYSITERERTGSIARITDEEIEKQPVNNPLAAMQGRMAGVNIVQNSGVPGSGFEVRIRGQNSIMAGNEPLYIIDGVPYDNSSLSAAGTSGPIINNANVSPLNAINPESIASIEVLKDADATAIYGSRGANGVVLITTKKGKQGKTQYTVSSQVGLAQVTKQIDLLKTDQYLTMRREAYSNDGITTYPENAYDVNGTWDQDRYTDWQEELIGGTANLHNLRLSIAGGSENTRFRLSGMTQKETTVYPGDYEYGRITANANLTHNSKDKRFKVSFTTGYTLEDNLLPEQDFSLRAMNLPPNAPSLYDEEGALNWEDNTWNNPLARLSASYQQNTKTFLSNLTVSYKIVDRLQLKLNTGYGTTNLRDFSKIPHTVNNPAFGLDSSSSSIITNDSEREYWIIEPQLEWSTQWTNSKLSVLLGSTFQEKTQQTRGFLGFGFANNRFMENISAANSLIALEEGMTNYKYNSFFGRINYAFKEKLFANITGRRDGSSRFGSDNKYGNFGAIGAAWLFSEDLEFDWLNFGKLRASYGITGNDQIGDYSYMRNYVISDYPYMNNPGLLPTRHYNPYFQWEKNQKREIAVDLGMFKHRLNTSISYYNNRSSNQLVDYALPGTTGFTSIQSNLDALVENSGWEFELSGKLIQTEQFNWTSSFNLSLPQNKLLEFPGLENSTYANRYVIGESLQLVKLYKLEGVNPETGLFEFKDYNGDEQITSEDRQAKADLSPRLFGGFRNSFTYKRWSVNVFLQFVKKDNYNQYRFSTAPGAMTNQPASVMDRWQNPGDQAKMQRFTSGADPEALNTYAKYTESTGIISDASFIRLKSASLAYNLPLKSETTSCRITLQGQNLLTFTDYPAGDPEQTRGFLPPLRRLMVGAELKF